MAIELSEYKNLIVDVALKTKQVIGYDIIVVDRWMSEVVNTYEYYKQPIDIRINSIVGNIIVTREPAIIMNRSQSKECLSCSDYYRCELESVIGIPIFDKEECVGAMAVLFNYTNSHVIGKSAENIQAFLTCIADLVISSIKSEKNSSDYELINDKVETLLSDLEDPIVCVDENNIIEYANRSFRDFFGMKDNARSTVNLKDLLQERTISGNSQGKGQYYFSDASDIVASCDDREFSWSFNGTKTHFLRFHLLSIEDLQRAPNNESIKKIFSDFWGPSNAMKDSSFVAKLATMNSLSVLIEGLYENQNMELMRLISLYNSDSGRSPSVIDCSNEPGRIESLLFGDQTSIPGIIWPPRGTCVCLSNVNRLPIYLQKRINSILLLQRQSQVTNKMRVFATSTQNLEELSKAGLFDRDFLLVISQNYVRIPDYKENKSDLMYYFQKYLNDFCAAYQKHPISVKDSLWDNIYQYAKNLTWKELQLLAEYQVIHCQGDLLDQLTFRTLQETSVVYEGKSNKDEMEEQIRLLLRANYKKTDIAKRLGISRATLYRWMEDMAV